ncbi:amino acid/polyamine/organocation transporter, APC superfamily [Thermoanaerobacter uzonensis DSM 18761]|jgi:APA family basic amino acid/polyamine antiporter|uniref:Amino acid/polyamine/organocation transporter, APC superfamily n=1 Tax=Thermoanaerobacter uzonensis DSM 18761 TaxID=1123369 RepID=A0A1M5B072_9THEO|nr:amino acid permease [Thermoanaerobacter uzonensis]SHF35859.1 amino acid/polyamine/organocation transporter, APC superfamily [Thermoanaerobacter uzonensis DSM 18761]
MASSSLFRKKTLDMVLSETEAAEYKLKKTLTAIDLIALGLGAIIGTGIFVITGVAAAEKAGPAIVLSFIIAGLACAFAAISYAELASIFPIAGSTYNYTYIAMGEFIAWIIGWDLILEYVFALPAISLGWSGYFTNLLASVGINIPAWAANSAWQAAGGLVNLPAMGILLVIAILNYIGVRETATVNNIGVAFKVFVVLFFIFVAAWHIKPVNWHPFMPYGWQGIFHGAAIIFFAYIGFDAVSTAAEETKNPAKDMPIGILGSLGISTLLYIAVSAILTGVVSYTELNDPAPVAKALNLIGLNWARGLVSLGAIVGITTVLLVMFYGSTRIIFAMSRDGLLPPVFSKVHPRFRTPSLAIYLIGIVTMLVAGFLPINIIAELVNIGTMLAFILTSIGVIVLRYKQPDLPRKFKAPGVPWTPLLAIAFVLSLMVSLPWQTWVRLIVWLIIGLFIYFGYGRHHSILAKTSER